MSTEKHATVNKVTEVSALREALAISAACLISFAGCYSLLPQFGAYRTLMLILPLSFACAAVKLKMWLKLAFFAGFGFALTTVYVRDTFESVVTGILCGVLLIVASFSLSQFKRGKANGIIAGIALILVAAGFHIFALGDPISAFRADSLINERINSRYDGESITVSETLFDRDYRLFYAELSAVTDPGTVARIYVAGDTVTDNFAPRAELLLMENNRLNLAAALREAYPTEPFTVKSVSLNGFRNGKISFTGEPAEASSMTFAVYISAYITDAEFESRAANYLLALRESGVGFAKIVFYGGRAGDYYRSVTLLNTALPQNTAPEFVRDNLTEEYVFRHFPFPK